MGYTSVRKCIHIEINTRFNLIHEREWTGGTVSNICKRYGMLKDIDTCLRGLWLECSGHLSSFTINNQRYESHPHEEYDFKDKSMQVRVNRIFEEGMIFEYIYDFGSST